MRREIASTRIPALTRPTISPWSRIGVTARTDSPSVPLYVSVKVCPASAGAVLPTNFLPIRSGVGWVQRMARGSMIVTKSTPVCRWTRSAYGWSVLDGSGVRIAARTEGESATERVTASACRVAASVA